MTPRPLRLRGTVLPAADQRELFICDGRITFEPIARAETLAEDGYLLTGLVDAHAHLALASPAPDDAPPDVTVRASARQQLIWRGSVKGRARWPGGGWS